MLYKNKFFQYGVLLILTFGTFLHPIIGSTNATVRVEKANEITEEGCFENLTDSSAEDLLCKNNDEWICSYWLECTWTSSCPNIGNVTTKSPVSNQPYNFPCYYPTACSGWNWTIIRQEVRQYCS